MKLVEPEVFVVAGTETDDEGITAYLRRVGALDWETDARSAIEFRPEFMGRLCYRSWRPKMNPNVTRVREGNDEYLGHILEVGHGSVIEHPVLTFVFADVSRVFTHELVRHPVGTAISQESLRFVRLVDIPFWIPGWARADEELMKRVTSADICPHCLEMRGILPRLGSLQQWMAGHFGLDNEKVPFSEKKARTSFMRRFAPEGVATTIGWSANLRTIRHVLESRTDPSAEEEIRLVFSKVGEIVMTRYPSLFGDYEVEIVNDLPHFKTVYRKV